MRLAVDSIARRSIRRHATSAVARDRRLTDTARTVILTEASHRREDRPTWADGEMEWVLYEREIMIAAVNQLRAYRRLQPVRRGDVEAAERRAVGHSDYTMKFALGCADLVHVSDEAPLPAG